MLKILDEIPDSMFLNLSSAACEIKGNKQTVTFRSSAFLQETYSVNNY
jgi:hypothetical protein